MLKHELRSNYKETLVVVRRLIRAAERLSGLQFQSIFLLSDEPTLFSSEATHYLSTSVRSPTKPKVIFNDYVAKHLANHEAYRKDGHGGLTGEEHAMIDRELAAEMALAGKHSSYIVGNGKSGISQLISQLIGAKYRMCPSTVSLFEDDTILLDSLYETMEWSWLLK
jgi:hypothetical protein